MDYVVLCLIVYIINKSAAGVSTKDNPRIIFTRSSSSTIEQAAHYTVVMNKPLDIHFQNMSVTRGWCFDYYRHQKNLDKSELPTLDNPSTIHLKHVSSDMSVLWKCNVTEDKNATSLVGGYHKYWDFRIKYYEFYLKLHVKGAKSVEMTINDNKISFSPVDLSVPYDGHSVYFYEDSEHVHIVCRNLQRTGAVYLEYFTNAGVSNVSMSARFDIQLHYGSDHSYIDCVYVTAEPDIYVYRVIFVTKKPSFYSTEKTDVTETANQDSDVNSSLLILGSSIGAVVVLLAVTVAAFCIMRTRKTKHIETPYVDLSNKSDIPTSQHTKENENQYDLCHYSDHLSNRDTMYNIPEGVEDIDPKYHQYTEIDYLSCKPKTCESQTRDSRVYDEPYVQITLSATVQTFKRV